MEKRKAPLPSHSPALFHYQHFVEAFLTFSMCVLLTVVPTYRSPEKGHGSQRVKRARGWKGEGPFADFSILFRFLLSLHSRIPASNTYVYSHAPVSPCFLGPDSAGQAAAPAAAW